MSRITFPCAIYTRKSSEEGLEQDFNSLHAQREACEAYIRSQQQEGWKLYPAHYDDGGYSGGTLIRPALKQLLEDIEQKRIRIVVVYKVDRLTRSLADFAKIIERFDALGVSFVSVTQQFSTTSSMGRLTLNVLLSFAQFEREVTGERIRDKIAASKKKGLWMGGFTPIGYQANGRVLEIEEAGARQIRSIFAQYLSLRCVRRLKASLDSQGIQTPLRQSDSAKQSGGRQYSRGQLYRILANPVYRGMIVHRKVIHPGQHPALIDDDTWSRVQQLLSENLQGYQTARSSSSRSFLAGKLFDASGDALSPSHAKKQTRRYRYYVSRSLLKGLRGDSPNGLRLPAAELESIVLEKIIAWLEDEHHLLQVLTIPAVEIQRVLAGSKEIAARLRDVDHPDFGAALNLLHAIRVEPNTLTIQLSESGLLNMLALDQATNDSTTIDLVFPITITRCGFSMRLMIAGKGRESTIDDRLIQSIRKGMNWLDQLTSGKAENVGSIAASEQVTNSHVTRMIYRAFLAPDIVQSILTGTHPPSLTSETLKKALPLPMDWNEQRRMFGFPLK